MHAPKPTLSRCASFLFTHALLIPAGFALAAAASHGTGFDERVSALFFDASAHTFPARSSIALEVIGHRLARSAIVGLWLTLFVATLAASLINRLPVRATLWTTLVAMALGPVIVVLLKSMNSLHCPWDLKLFGGYAEFTSRWFVSVEHAGHCFPSGHAAGGYSLVAVMFAGIAEGHRRLCTIGLVAAICAGTAFSVVRIAQGAHFLSHNLWSAAIDWSAAALAFAPLLALRDRERCLRCAARR